MYRDKGLKVIIHEGLVATDIASQSQIMKRHEDGVSADKREPEMNLAQGLVHHAAEHLGKPEVGAGKDAEHRRYSHHHVEMSDHEIRGMQHDVNRRLRQEETAYSAGDKHRDET